MKEVSILTDKECLEDLEAIKDGFLKYNGGCCPLCIYHAMDVLKEKLKKEEQYGTGKSW